MPKQSLKLLSFAILIQVNNFQKFPFVHHFINKFDRFFLHSRSHVDFLFKFFDNKRDFLKIIDLYRGLLS